MIDVNSTLMMSLGKLGAVLVQVVIWYIPQGPNVWVSLQGLLAAFAVVAFTAWVDARRELTDDTTWGTLLATSFGCGLVDSSGTVVDVIGRNAPAMGCHGSCSHHRRNDHL